MSSLEVLKGEGRFAKLRQFLMRKKEVEEKRGKMEGKTYRGILGEKVEKLKIGNLFWNMKKCQTSHLIRNGGSIAILGDMI